MRIEGRRRKRGCWLAPWLAGLLAGLTGLWPVASHWRLETKSAKGKSGYRYRFAKMDGWRSGYVAIDGMYVYGLCALSAPYALYALYVWCVVWCHGGLAGPGGHVQFQSWPRIRPKTAILTDCDKLGGRPNWLASRHLFLISSHARCPHRSSRHSSPCVLPPNHHHHPSSPSSPPLGLLHL